MKIALSTWFHFHNYGTALQVCALTEILKKGGHNVDIVNYVPNSFYRRSVADYSISAVGSRVLNRFKKQTSQKAYSPHFDNAEKSNLFSLFYEDKLTFTKPCSTYADLYNLNDKYDAFVCGSDQIWSPNNFDPHYYFDYVNNTEKMISYAPSVGLPKISDKNIKKEMRSLILRFKHLSVREKQGSELIKKLTGKQAKVVCDPTLLLCGDEWRKLCKTKRTTNQKSYLLTYMLGQNDYHWDKVYSVANQLGLEVRIIPVFENDLNRKGCIKEAIGPNEFVNLIDNAQIVCTDSFHGMIFSALLHKQFIPFERFYSEDPINQNSRVYNLLSIIGLFDRLVSYNGGNHKTESINFEVVDKKLQVVRDESLKYLTDALNSVCLANVKNKNHIIVDNSLCCGCGACENICPIGAISVNLNVNGFISANVDEDKCINCGRCITVCPFRSSVKENMMSDSSLYSYKDNDEDILKVSSSGGFAYELSKRLIEDGYTVAGCTFDRNTQTAKHILVDNIDSLYLLQGSKYMQSEFSSVLKSIEMCEKPVAIFGTPCQISAAKKLFSKRNDILYIDLICHGVPTYNLYRKYKIFLSNKHGLNNNKMHTEFRYKPMGWRKIYLFSTDGEKSACYNQKEDLYFCNFEIGNCYMQTCYDCRWRDRSDADLRIGDYWGPRFKNDKTGVSMIAVMNETGAKAIEVIKDTGKINSQPIEDYMKFQQIKNEHKPLFYDDFIYLLKDNKDNLEWICDKYAGVSKKKPVGKIGKMLKVANMMVCDKLYLIGKELKK